jgi:hypothetical protein
MSRLLTLLLMLFSLAAYGHEIDVPANVEGGHLIVARAKGDEKAKGFVWIVADQTGSWLLDNTIVFRDPRTPDVIVIGGGEGKYQLMLLTSLENGTLEQSTAVTFRGAVIPPTPPTPPVPPTPPTPPAPPSGPRNVLVVYESSKQTPAMNVFFNQFRNGTYSQYVRDHKHVVDFLDDNTIDRNKRPAPAVEAWRPFYKDLGLPAVVITDPVTRTVITKESLRGPDGNIIPGAADKLLNLLKATGG